MRFATAQQELCGESTRGGHAASPHFLAEAYGVQLRLGVAVTDIEMPRLRTASGETWLVERAFVCSGTDFQTLFPAAFATSGLRRCKLQMMKTGPQPGGWWLRSATSPAG